MNNFQIIVAAIKNLIVLKKGCFYNLVPIIIPSLLGISNGLNPGETIRITANEASWLCKLNENKSKSKLRCDLLNEMKLFLF